MGGKLHGFGSGLRPQNSNKTIKKVCHFIDGLVVVFCFSIYNKIAFV